MRRGRRCQRYQLWKRLLSAFRAKHFPCPCSWKCKWAARAVVFQALENRSPSRVRSLAGGQLFTYICICIWFSFCPFVLAHSFVPLERRKGHVAPHTWHKIHKLAGGYVRVAQICILTPLEAHWHTSRLLVSSESQFLLQTRQHP